MRRATVIASTRRARSIWSTRFGTATSKVRASSADEDPSDVNDHSWQCIGGPQGRSCKDPSSPSKGGVVAVLMHPSVKFTCVFSHGFEKSSEDFDGDEGIRHRAKITKLVKRLVRSVAQRSLQRRRRNKATPPKLRRRCARRPHGAARRRIHRVRPPGAGAVQVGLASLVCGVALATST